MSTPTLETFDRLMKQELTEATGRSLQSVVDRLSAAADPDAIQRLKIDWLNREIAKADAEGGDEPMADVFAGLRARLSAQSPLR